MAAPSFGTVDYMGRNSLFMLTGVVISAFIGMILGYFSGLGIGGGSLLILWLTLVLNIDTQSAQIINLLFFLACAGSVTLIRLKKGTLQFRSIIPGIIAGCLFAVLFSYLGGILPQQLLRKLFGIVLLVTGLRELLYRQRKAR